MEGGRGFSALRCGKWKGAELQCPKVWQKPLAGYSHLVWVSPKLENVSCAIIE